MSTMYVVLLLLPLSLVAGVTIQRHGDNTVERFKRSLKLAEIGAAAAQTLLKGSAKIEKRSKSFNFFMKLGTKRTAYHDFMAVVNPETVIKHDNMYRAHYEGKAGDRILYYTPHDHHEKSLPSITVFDPKRASRGESGPLSDKIIYRDIDIE